MSSNLIDRFMDDSVKEVAYLICEIIWLPVVLCVIAWALGIK